MRYVGDLLALLLAVAAAHILGAYRGRRDERIRLYRRYGVRSGSELRRIEAELRRSLRVPQLPVNPEDRPRQYAIRIRR